MADVNRGNRPLSPHLTIYRMPMTAITSILNRITGVALLGGGLLVVWWLLAAASSPSYYAFADAVITSFIGDVVMTLSGLEVETAEKLSYGILGASVVLTLLTVIVV